MSQSNYHSGRKRSHCYFCGAFGNLQEHHIIPDRFDGPDKPENIVELCSTCHDKIERLYDKQFYEHFGIEDEKGRRAFHRTCGIADCTDTVQIYFRDAGLGFEHRYCLDHALEWAKSKIASKRKRTTPHAYLSKLDPETGDGIVMRSGEYVEVSEYD